MNISLNALVAATLVCWGACGISDKKAVERGTPVAVFLAVYACSAACVPLTWLVFAIFHVQWHLSAELLMWTGLATLAYTVALPAYLVAMSKAEASYVFGITACYPLVLQLLAAVFLNEPLLAGRMLGAGLVGLGVGAIGGSHPEMHHKLSRSDKIALWTSIVIATISWGVWGLFDKKALLAGTPAEAFFGHRIWEAVTLLVTLALVHATRMKVNLRSPGMWVYSALSVLLLLTGSWTFLNAIAVASASYVITITGCYPLFMYLLALWLLGERFNKVRLVGLILVVLGGIMVQNTQSV